MSRVATSLTQTSPDRTTHTPADDGCLGGCQPAHAHRHREVQGRVAEGGPLGQLGAGRALLNLTALEILRSGGVLRVRDSCIWMWQRRRRMREEGGEMQIPVIAYRNLLLRFPLASYEPCHKTSANTRPYNHPPVYPTIHHSLPPPRAAPCSGSRSPSGRRKRSSPVQTLTGPTAAGAPRGTRKTSVRSETCHPESPGPPGRRVSVRLQCKSGAYDVSSEQLHGREISEGA